MGMTPGVYFLAFRRGGTFLSAEAPEHAGEWIARYTPHSSSAVLLDGLWFTEAPPPREPLYGVAVDAKLALDIGLDPAPEVSYLPPRSCVVTTVRFSYGDPDYTDAIRRVRAWAEPRGLRLQGGAFIRLTQSLIASDDLQVRGLLYAPLKEDSAALAEVL